ncbi:CopG family ribbon-helix-helix protein [Geoalkalibacter halelectricus]|uniref:CopG family ribbon-helix-helix protein n=1 Tax=Geoalkalibacter halelectricus TaxID=2847045 RepID=A0ABY5ZHQ9_9BACT|nr:CopG family ribbon-helix-helix protein [Geoalkalibacter halelectricus]MDO3377760.1 CopG family ribbon-helix-helix protein [Geoalkalibacter halelectricus]UWZ78646.1 CopG family ribbon-helix-helix protein [Geoalkalibacter halelectricus]
MSQGQSTTKEQVSFRLPADTRERIERLARATRRSRTFVIEEAINRYLDLNEWQIAEIEQGLEEARTGKVVPHEEIVAKWEARRADSVD